MRRTLALLLAGLVVFGACGGDDDEAAEVPSLEESDADDDEEETSTVDTEEALLDFSECMREEGVTNFPDVTPGGGVGQVLSSGVDVTSNRFQDALAECQPLIEGVFDLDDLDAEQTAELQDITLEIVRCMQDRDYDVPDPDFSKGFGPQMFGDLSKLDIDFQDPKFRTDMRECFSEAGLGAGGTSTTQS